VEILPRFSASAPRARRTVNPQRRVKRLLRAFLGQDSTGIGVRLAKLMVPRSTISEVVRRQPNVDPDALELARDDVNEERTAKVHLQGSLPGPGDLGAFVVSVRGIRQNTRGLGQVAHGDKADINGDCGNEEARAIFVVLRGLQGAIGRYRFSQ
jgi:hypothetical protein